MIELYLALFFAAAFFTGYYGGRKQNNISKDIEISNIQSDNEIYAQTIRELNSRNFDLQDELITLKQKNESRLLPRKNNHPNYPARDRERADQVHQRQLQCDRGAKRK
ncbi:MAG: hypothetical protein IT235_07495 [Bacteroidia bacterium]|nr:hypothetical protein [Bacteroidia bacterium]